MSAIVIGMGNPLLSDDGVGLRIARELRRCLAGRSDVDVVELHAGGLRLMEAMAGYDIAIVADAIVSGLAPGTIQRLSLSDLPRTRTAHSSHDGSLNAAMDLGRIAGLQLPEEVRIWAIEAADVATFGETLTPCVDRAAARTVDEILGSLALEGEPHEDRRLFV